MFKSRKEVIVLKKEKVNGDRLIDDSSVFSKQVINLSQLVTKKGFDSFNGISNNKDYRIINVDFNTGKIYVSENTEENKINKRIEEIDKEIYVLEQEKVKLIAKVQNVSSKHIKMILKDKIYRN